MVQGPDELGGKWQPRKPRTRGSRPRIAQPTGDVSPPDRRALHRAGSSESYGLALTPRHVAQRVRKLIARHDGGDVARAARRLGVGAERLCRLDRALAADSPTRVALLATIGRSYHADVCWLLTGVTCDDARALPDEVRLELSGTLMAVAEQMLEVATAAVTARQRGT